MRILDPATQSSPIAAHSEVLPAIVGIGASAGGLEALEHFFRAVKPDLGFAYLVVMHLDPRRKTLLPSLLQRFTTMPVAEVAAHSPPRPNHIYTIPPNKVLTFENGLMKLTPPKLPHGFRDPINSLFSSLAEAGGAGSTGLIFSGTGTDGVHGCAAIRKAGGFVAVQSLKEAAFSGMPASVRDSELASLVAPTAEIAYALAERSTHARQLFQPIESLEVVRDHKGDVDVDAILNRLHEVSGKDFSQYRRSTILRRLTQRINLLRVGSMAEYLRRLDNDTQEAGRLVGEMLINVTSFFRDPESYSALAETVVPRLVRMSDKNMRHIRIWVAGCSSGEEAYSLAILLLEEIDRLKSNARVHIFATDVDPEALEIAREGVYPEAALENIGEDRKLRFFRVVDGGYKVSRRLRDAIIFSQHDLATDAPLPRMHMVSCRNVMIYFEEQLQRRVLDLFHYSLGSNGYLFLGTSDSCAENSPAFTVLDKDAKIYRKSDGELGSHATTSLPPRMFLDPQRKTNLQHRPRRVPRAGVSEVESAVLRKALPPTLVVRPNREIVLLLGGVGTLMDSRDGSPPSHTDQILPESARSDFSALLRELANPEKTEARVEGVSFENSRKKSFYDLKGVRLSDTDTDHPLFAVSFYPTTHSSYFSEFDSAIRDEHHDENWYRQRITQLEMDLQRAKRNLSETVHELETSNQDYQASNEELSSLNEELQTATEELETSKEELQSINEELQSVNSELQLKVNQLADSNDDLNNLLGSTDIGIIFLDGSLCFKRFTRVARDLFGLHNADIGRHISHIGAQVEGANIIEACQTSIECNQEVVRDVRLKGVWNSLRVLPYRNHDDTISGLILAFTNIMELKASQESLQRFRGRSKALIDSIPAPLLLCNSNGVIVYCKPGRGNIQLFSDDSVLGKRLSQIRFAEIQVPTRELEAVERMILQTSSTGKEHCKELCVSIPSGPSYWFEVQTVLCGEEGVLTLFHNVSERKKLEMRLEAALRSAELSNRAKTDFLANISHELRTPLNAVIGFSELLQNDPGQLSENDRAGFTKQIEQSGRVLLSLVNELLELARVDSGQLALKLRKCSAASLVRSSVALVQTQARSKDVTLKVELPSKETVLFVDEDRIKQVLINLLGNAIKYTPTGGEIDVRTYITPRERLEVVIADSGPGITPDMLQRVFDRFTRGPGKDSEGNPIPGTGLGLAIVKGLVEAHGGDVRAETPGVGDKGSRFIVSLPMGAA